MKNLRQARQHRRIRRSRHRSRHRVIDHFGVELGACKESDTPGKMVFFWRDGPGGLNDRGIAGYAYNDEQHQIAQRIGREMQPFLAGLSSDPHYCRGRGLLTRSEVTTLWILCCFLGPLAMYWLCYIISEKSTREAMGKQKLIDSIHDMARCHDLKAYVSPMTSYFTLTDSTPGGMPQNLVQQPMMMMGTPQAMPPPGQEMYQQQPVYAPYGQEMYQQQLAYAPPPIGGLPMMPPGYAQAPQGYAHTPQYGNYGAPPIEAYDPMNVK
jgi:hypothetical protein